VQYLLEVATVPVTDVDRSLAFYADQLGFGLDVDVDYQPSGTFRVVQLTPPGSACSIQLESSPSGSPTSHYLVVPDIELARREPRDRGVAVTAIRHKDPVEAWAGGWAAAIDPGRRDYASFAELADPDGNVWVPRERGFASERDSEAKST
jgi:catechol 2,3-dioxygenase-like lactoylglutathione lyase family enzyme